MSLKHFKIAGFLIFALLSIAPLYTAQAEVAATVAHDAEMENISDNTGIKNRQQIADFLRTLQQALKSNDRKTVAAMIKYPLTVNGSGRQRAHIYKNSADVLAQ